MNQGETTQVTIKFKDSIEGLDFVLAMYDDNDNKVFVKKLSDPNNGIENMGDNTYRITFPHSITKDWEGKYYFALALKDAIATDPVNIGENVVKVNFKKAKISEEI